MTDTPDTTGATPAGDAPAAPSPDDAKAQLDALQDDADSRDILLNRQHPEHKALIDKRRALTAAVFPDGDVPPEFLPLADARYDDDVPSDLRDAMEAELTPPETPEDYQLQRVMPAEEDTLEQFTSGKELVAGWAHDAGFTQGEVSTLTTKYNDLMHDEGRHDPAAIETMQGTTASALRAVWGGGFDANMAAATKEAARLGDHFIFFLRHTRLGDDPWMIKALADAATQRTERTERRGKRQARREAREKAQGDPMSADAAREQIEKMNAAAVADPASPLLNRSHPGHRAAQDKRHKLYLAAYPGATGPA